MKCPYCLSEVEDQALVCKVCTKDLYLFKPLLAQVAELQAKLAAAPDVSVYETRIAALEAQLAASRAQLDVPRTGIWDALNAVALYLVLPLSLLLAAHALITIVLDAPLIYLRLVSIAIPLPFGLFLFLFQRRAVIPWFAATVALAVAAVIGMSWITSLVDQTPVLPQNAFEWREYLEYASSISFSFLTGMLLGGILYARRDRRVITSGASTTRAAPGGWVRTLVSMVVGGKLNVKQIADLVDKIESYGSSLAALGATAMSIYTGLKTFLGG
jgi:hypothetical protein